MRFWIKGVRMEGGRGDKMGTGRQEIRKEAKYYRKFIQGPTHINSHRRKHRESGRGEIHVCPLN